MRTADPHRSRQTYRRPGSISRWTRGRASGVRVGSMPTRTELGVAAVCTAWAGLFLAGEGALLAFAPLLGLAALPFRRRPVWAALAAAGVTLAAFVAGLSEESPATLATGLTVTCTASAATRPVRRAPVRAGRRAGSWRSRSSTGRPSPMSPSSCSSSPRPGRAAAWCGAGTEGARQAAATAAELAARDPSVLAARVVAEERARLAGDALAVIRRAVTRDAARRRRRGAPISIRSRLPGGPGGRPGPPSPSCGACSGLLLIRGRRQSAVGRGGGGPRTRPSGPAPAIGGRPSNWLSAPDGRSAVGHRTGSCGPSGRSTVGHRTGSSARRTARHAEALVALGLMALCLVDVAAWHAPAPLPGAIALTLALAAPRPPSSASTRRSPAWWPRSPPALALAPRRPAGLRVLHRARRGRARVVGGRRRPPPGPPWVALARPRRGDACRGQRRPSPGNEGILLAAFALTGTCRPRVGSARSRGAGRGDDRLPAAEPSTRRRAERAIRAERLRLARELHDVASHAVGAMVLQAGAALAVRERDPDAALSLRSPSPQTGSEALGELSVLFGLLDAGAVGPAGLAAAHARGRCSPARSRRSPPLAAAVSRCASARQAPLPDDPLLAADHLSHRAGGAH